MSNGNTYEKVMDILNIEIAHCRQMYDRCEDQMVRKHSLMMYDTYVLTMKEYAAKLEELEYIVSKINSIIKAEES